MSDFHRTVMGHRFYEGTMPELVAQLRRLNGNIEKFVADPTPSPTGTELALIEAKRHIAILTKFWMESDGWHEASEAARAFIGGVPFPSSDVQGLPKQEEVRKPPP